MFVVPEKWGQACSVSAYCEYIRMFKRLSPTERTLILQDLEKRVRRSPFPSEKILTQAIADVFEAFIAHDNDSRMPTKPIRDRLKSLETLSLIAAKQMTSSNASMQIGYMRYLVHVYTHNDTMGRTNDFSTTFNSAPMILSRPMATALSRATYKVYYEFCLSSSYSIDHVIVTSRDVATHVNKYSDDDQLGLQFPLQINPLDFRLHNITVLAWACVSHVATLKRAEFEQFCSDAHLVSYGSKLHVQCINMLDEKFYENSYDNKFVPLPSAKLLEESRGFFTVGDLEFEKLADALWKVFLSIASRLKEETSLFKVDMLIADTESGSKQDWKNWAVIDAESVDPPNVVLTQLSIKNQFRRLAVHFALQTFAHPRIILLNRFKGAADDDDDSDFYVHTKMPITKTGVLIPIYKFGNFELQHELQPDYLTRNGLCYLKLRSQDEFRNTESFDKSFKGVKSKFKQKLLMRPIDYKILDKLNPTTIVAGGLGMLLQDKSGSRDVLADTMTESYKVELNNNGFTEICQDTDDEGH